MPEDVLSPANPTAGIDLDFSSYVASRQSTQREHFIGEVPDYSFALDAVLRQRIATMGPVRSIAQMIVSASAPMHRQLHHMSSLRVGPELYPQLYALGEQCARRLGIAIPQIYISPESEPNAFTLFGDDLSPSIILTRGLVELLDQSELLFVIGHECGHIHNLHGVYNTAVELLANPTARVVLQKLLSVGTPLPLVHLLATAIQGSLRLFLLSWSRCAEITCDRTGLICSGNLSSAQQALVKLVVGGGELLKSFDVDAYLSQSRGDMTVAAIWAGLQHTHPLIPRRIEALRIFAETETFFQWRPDITEGRTAHFTKEEADARCEQIVGIQ